MNEQIVIRFIAKNPELLEPGLFPIPFPGSRPSTGIALDFLAVDENHGFVMIFVQGRMVQSVDLKTMYAQGTMVSGSMLSASPFRLFVVGADFSADASSFAHTDGSIRLIKMSQLFPNMPAYVFSGTGPCIDLGGDWSDWPDTYDPFTRSQNNPTGLIYFINPGCSIRSTRCYGYDRLDLTQFSVGTPTLRSASIDTGHQHEYQALGRVDIKAGRPVPLPKVDPNCAFRALVSPALSPSSYTIEEDGASNLFLTLEDDYRGMLKYTVSTAQPIKELAFSSMPKAAILNPHDDFGIPALQNSFATIDELIRAMQGYFSTYNRTCTIDFSDLESQPDASAKIAYMIKHTVGSCRHRAFLGFRILEPLGLPLRYLTSRTHAWLELELAGIWRYIDLGGCPVTMLNQPDTPPPGTLEPPFEGERIDASHACIVCPDWKHCMGKNVGRCGFTMGGKG